MVNAIEARDRYTVVFSLKEPFGSFPVNLVIPIVPDGAGPPFRDHPIGTGPYRFVSYATDDRLELARFDDYFGGRPQNDGLILRIVPDDIMRGLELRKGTMDIVVNDLAPDIVYQLGHDPDLQLVKAPGVDYQYIGVNLRDPILQNKLVRQAIASAIDRDAIIEHLRRGLAIHATGILPPVSWAFSPAVAEFKYDPARARELLDQAGYRDSDGDGPVPRLHLSLKMSNIEFNRLQASVIQENLRAVGIALDVRTYEFATLYADVLKGNFQLYFLQWVGGAVADPDILRRVFHSTQVPPSGFNRGYFKNAQVDGLLDQAAAATDESERRDFYGAVQRIVADEQPYISLWCKTNVAVARRSLAGFHILPTADFTFLKDVARTTTDAAAALARPSPWSVRSRRRARAAQACSIRHSNSASSAPSTSESTFIKARISWRAGCRPLPRTPGAHSNGRSASGRLGSPTWSLPIRPNRPMAMPRRCPTTRL